MNAWNDKLRTLYLEMSNGRKALLIQPYGTMAKNKDRLETETTKVADHLLAKTEFKTTVKGDEGEVSARSSSREQSQEDAMKQYENLKDD